MKIELNVPDSIPLDPKVTREMQAFLQAFVNRRCVGALRYGDRPQRRQKYMSRLEREVAAYRASGNFEQLLNVAVYCFLESVAPENRKLHWDAAVESITRVEFGV